MNATDEAVGISSPDLADLSQVSLADLATFSDDDLADVLDLAVPSSAGQVPVAAFNSSI